MAAAMNFAVRGCRSCVGVPGATFQHSQRAPALRSRVLLRASTAEAKAEKKTKVEEEFSDGPDTAPSTQQVADLLSTLCNDTEIAEMEVQMGNFRLKVRRSLDSSAGSPPPAPALAAAGAPSSQLAEVVVARPALPPMADYLSVEEVAADESLDEALIYVRSPKVGIFRRGKYVAGKRVGKGDLVKAGDTVKKGQALGYVEQLGTFVPVEAPQAGEVVSFKAKEGDAVEYLQDVVEIAPFFGGHIIGDLKHA